jgi:hypothetical protein
MEEKREEKRMGEAIDAFAKALSENPKLVEQLQRKAEIEEFKKKYNVDKSSPLRCPACSQYGYAGGALWFSKTEPTKCVCRKCKTEWNIECLSMTNEEKISEVRAMIKGEMPAPKEETEDEE